MKGEQMRILLYCPLHPETPKIFGRTLNSIFRQEYDPLEIWFSKGDNPQDTGVPMNDGRANTLHNYKKARQATLDQGFDALMTVERDMIIPSDAVQRLLDCDADIAYGLYVFRAVSSWSAFTRLDRKSGRSISKDPALAKRMWGKQMDVAGVGFGCTLIKRHVLEAIEFRGAPGAANDWFFAQDAQEHGFKQVCDLGLVCGHIDTLPMPRVIWPDPEMPNLYRNEFIKGIPVNEKGEVEIEIGRLGEFYIPKDALYREVE
jgi:hypothetical protein